MIAGMNRTLWKKVVNRFVERPEISALSVATVDEHRVTLARTAPTTDVIITLKNCMRRGLAISYGIFMRGDLVRRVGEFNETLGVGAGTPWGAGEESDFLIRGLKLGGTVVYTPSIAVFHPRNTAEWDSRRVLGYAMGSGRVLKINGYSVAHLAEETLRYAAIFVAKSLIDLKPDKTSLVRAYGHIKGYFSA